MKTNYRNAMNIAEDERILFKLPEMPNHAVGVVRAGKDLFIKILGSVDRNFREGPDDMTYWPNLPIEAVRLSVKVYDIFQNDDWKNYTQGIYFETWRT
jgi:hypothetical protein